MTCFSVLQTWGLGWILKIHIVGTSFKGDWDGNDVVELAVCMGTIWMKW